ncbi:MAG: glycosyltransferase [Bacteroidota bacterium]
MNPVYSIIVPVYDRPDEIRELLTSLKQQRFRSFEVIVVEDGSVKDCEREVRAAAQDLTVRYFRKENEGPGPARNFGFGEARGEFFIVFDSDCLIPEGYLDAVEAFRRVHQVDAWGGPDAGHPACTTLQQDMAWTRSSWLTTGGIRGRKGALDSFQPRSFNMGISRKVWEATGGFRFDRSAEDIELSIRLRDSGFQVWLIAEAFVYHKRRTSLSQFFRQVTNFGRGRMEVAAVHRGTLKLAHWLPLIFTAGLIVSLFTLILFPEVGRWMAGLYGMYLVLIFAGATAATGSVQVGVLAIPSVLVQLSGYARGFVTGFFAKRS